MAFQIGKEWPGKQDGNNGQGLEDKMPTVWVILPSDAYPKATGHQKGKSLRGQSCPCKCDFNSKKLEGAQVPSGEHWRECFKFSLIN